MKKIKEDYMKYKSFSETFKFCSFALALGLIYPNRKTVCKRSTLFFLVLLFNFGTLFWFIWYTIECLVQLDIYNSTRNITVGVIILLFVFKTIYANLKTEMFATLLELITKDLLKGNSVDPDYQEIYNYYIDQGLFGQKCYVVIPMILCLIFPVYAGSAMIYESMRSDDFKKYMVHEMDLKLIEDKQYDFPYFQLVFAYYTLGIFVLVPNFAGFDGSFCIATSHLRLKIKLMTHNIQRALRDSKDILELRARLKMCVRDHQEALDFYTLIQKLYGTWLFAVFMLTSFLISCNLYQIYLTGIDPRYTLFALTGVFHMYTPCYFASCLIQMPRKRIRRTSRGESDILLYKNAYAEVKLGASLRRAARNLGEQSSTDMYCAQWEHWADPAVTKFLIFIIARAQKRLLLHGLGIVTFNMESFVSLMQTSYSFFTLITSK